MTNSEKIYRLLLRAYPSGYRRRYAEPMAQLFRDRLRSARTWVEAIVLWRQTLADWLISVPARHWERLGPAREYGSLAAPAQRCIFFARREASSFARPEITIEHLLLGILREDPSLVRAASFETVVAAIEAKEPATRRVAPNEDLRVSWEARRAIEAAQEIARAAERDVEPADLAQGILKEGHTLAAALLRANGTGSI